MAKGPTLSDITTSTGSKSVINSNNGLIETAFENTISRDGSTPNQMEADLDLNDNDLLNVKSINTKQLKINGAVAVSTSALLIWKGAWTTSTSYIVNDIVNQGGNAYICLSDHTSGTFSTDLGNSLWELFVSKGDNGVGTGDMLASNNLSEVDADSARTNLGLVIGANVQAYSTILADFIAQGISGYSGVDTTLMTGTYGGSQDNGDFVQFNDDGDIISSSYSVRDEDDLGGTTPSSVHLPTQENVNLALRGEVGTYTFSSEGPADFTFTNPDGISHFILMLNDVYVDSSSEKLLVQLGTASGIDTTSYVGAVSVDTNGGNSSSTEGFVFRHGSNGSQRLYGLVEFWKGDGNEWFSSHSLGRSSARPAVGGGYKLLSEPLTQFRVTRTGGSSGINGTIHYRVKL